MKEIDLQTLSECNGKDGRPLLVAYEGKVYDLSMSKLWSTGLHMNRHCAGKDLTSDIQAAPHTPDVLQKFPQVGMAIFLSNYSFIFIMVSFLARNPGIHGGL